MAVPSKPVNLYREAEEIRDEHARCRARRAGLYGASPLQEWVSLRAIAAAMTLLAWQGESAAQVATTSTAADAQAVEQDSAEVPAAGVASAEDDDPPPQRGWYADDPVARARALDRGQAVYLDYCAECHGVRGTGWGAAARYLRVRPRDFTKARYKWRRTGSGELPSDDDLLRTVRWGVPGTSMPGWRGRLPDDHLRAVVVYLKTFSASFAEDEIPAAVAIPATAPDFDDAARRRGRHLYVLMRCWSCHGMSGAGDGPSADTLEDSDGRPVEAYDFTSGQLRSGRHPVDIYRSFTTGVNGTPMPEFAEALVFGGDAFEDLSPFADVLADPEKVDLQAYLQAIPTAAAISGMTGAQQEAIASKRRWDLTAYVLSLSEGSAVGRYLFGLPYVTE